MPTGFVNRKIPTAFRETRSNEGFPASSGRVDPQVSFRFLSLKIMGLRLLYTGGMRRILGTAIAKC